MIKGGTAGGREKSTFWLRGHPTEGEIFEILGMSGGKSASPLSEGKPDLEVPHFMPIIALIVYTLPKELPLSK